MAAEAAGAVIYPAPRSGPTDSGTGGLHLNPGLPHPEAHCLILALLCDHKTLSSWPPSLLLFTSCTLPPGATPLLSPRAGN